MSDAKTVREMRPAPYNPRKISDARLAMLGAAMREFGDLSGIVVNTRTGNMVGGHQRVKHLDPSWEIVKEPHADKVGTVAVGHVETPFGRWQYREVAWDERKEKAANIAANKHSGEFNIPALKEILVDLDDGGMDLSLTGFDTAELKDLIDFDGGKGIADDNEVPEPPTTAITKPGDLWALGENHRLLCGDATDAKDARRMMGTDLATVIFTDPPYGVGIGKKNTMLNTFQPSGRCLDDLQMDDMDPKGLGDMLLKAFTLWRKFMADDCSVFVCSPQGGGLGMMMMMMRDSGLEIRHVLNWIKNAPTFSMGRLDYDYQHEPILFTWGKTHKRKKEGAFQTSTWTVDKPRANKHHPTMKPVELPVCAILNHSDEGDVVADMFGGSGTTLIACEKTARKSRTLEISPNYCDVIVGRWEALTGRKAVKVEAQEAAT